MARRSSTASPPEPAGPSVGCRRCGRSPSSTTTSMRCARTASSPRPRTGRWRSPAALLAGELGSDPDRPHPRLPALRLVRCRRGGAVPLPDFFARAHGAPPSGPATRFLTDTEVQLVRLVRRACRTARSRPPCTTARRRSRSICHRSTPRPAAAAASTHPRHRHRRRHPRRRRTDRPGTRTHRAQPSDSADPTSVLDEVDLVEDLVELVAGLDGAEALRVVGPTAHGSGARIVQGWGDRTGRR